MLQSLRDNLKGTAAVIVIGMMVVPMALFGVDSIFSNSGGAANDVVSVNGEAITEAELQRAIFFRQNQMRAQFGENLPRQLISTEVLREPVLDSLITREALAQRVREGGMSVPEQRIDQILLEAPEFQTDGRFDANLFRSRVNNVGYTPAGYRQRLAEDIMLNQHVQGVASSGFVTQQELERIATLSQQTRDFYYLTIPLAPVLAEVQVDEEQAQAFYEEHKSEFRNPEQVTIEYLEVNLEQIANQIDISEAQVREQYQQEVDAFQADVQRQAAHILVEPQDDGSEQAVLEEIQQRLAAGEDFAALAEEYSDDFGSRNNGGDLGVTSGDTFPDAFEDALAQLDEGEVSGPVRTDAGYHIIKLLDERGMEPPTFEESRARIESTLKRAEAEDRFIGLNQELADVTYNSDDLADAGEILGLERKVAGPFSRDGGLGLASNQEVVETAFGDEVLGQGYTSGVLELGPEHVLVLRVIDHEEARTLTFEEVRTEVERTLKQQLAEEQVAQLGQELEAQIAAAKSVEEVAKERGYEWQVSLDTSRTSAQANREVLRHVFSMPRPQAESVTSGFNNANGDYVLVNLTDVTDGSYAAMSAAERASLRERLAGMAGNLGYAAYEAQVKQAAEVERL